MINWKYFLDKKSLFLRFKESEKAWRKKGENQIK